MGLQADKVTGGQSGELVSISGSAAHLLVTLGESFSFFVPLFHTPLLPPSSPLLSI